MSHIVMLYDSGVSLESLSEQFRLPMASVIKLVHYYKTGGTK
jgi:hypothetical protein